MHDMDDGELSLSLELAEPCKENFEITCFSFKLTGKCPWSVKIKDKSNLAFLLGCLGNRLSSLLGM